MGYKVNFDNGQSVVFDTMPTQADIEDAHTHIMTGAPAPNSTPQDLASKIPGMVATIPPAPPAPTLMQNITGGIEAGINTGAGLLGMIPGTIAAGTNLANTAVREGRLQTPSELEQSFSSGASILDPVTKYLMDKSSPRGRELTDKAGELISEYGGALGGLHGSLPSIKVGEGANAMAARFSKTPVPEVSLPSSKLAALDAIDKQKQAQATLPPPVDPTLDYYKQRAIDTQQAAILEQHSKGQQPITVDQTGNAYLSGEAPPPKSINGQGELFPASQEGLATPYDAGQAGVSSPVTPLRSRAQMDLPLRNDLPDSINVDEAGVSYPPEQRTAIEAAKDKALSFLDEDARLKGNQEFLGAKQQEMWATDHSGDLAKDGEIAPKAPPAEYTKQGDWVGDREANRPFTDLRAADGNGERPLTRNEYEQTISNLSKEIGTKYDRPTPGPETDLAYQKYLEQVSGKQADMFDIGSRQDAFQTASAAEGLNRAIDNHPFVRNAEKALSKQEEFVQNMTEQVKAGVTRATALVSEMNDLKKAQEKVATVRANVSEALSKKASPKPLENSEPIKAIAKPQNPFRSDVVDMNSGIPIPDFVKNKISKALDDFNDGLRAISNARFDSKGKATEYFKTNIPEALQGAEGKLAKPDSADVTVSKILVDGTKDTPPINGLNRVVQSGADLVAGKHKENPLLIATSRALNYALSATELAKRQFVKPLEKFLSTLPVKEFMENQDLFRREMFAKERLYTDEELSRAGFTDRQIDAYKMQRTAFDTSLDIQNKARDILGKEPISRGEAYMSSIWHGDYHAPIFDKDGRLVWYIRTVTAKEGKLALQHLREAHPDLVIPDSPEFRGTKGTPGSPTDMAGAYHDMLGFFKDDPVVSAQIQEALQGFMTDRGYKVAGQDKHFINKTNVRGFIGDQPWLSEKENAYGQGKAQIEYLNNSLKWANTQEAIATLKQVFSNPEVLAKMPNAIDYAKSVLDHELGINKNLLAGAENELAHMLGVSRSSLYRTTGTMKTGMYLQMLGASTGYMVATPLQAVMTTPMWHNILSGEGFKHNVFKTTALSLADTSAGIVAHLAHELGASNAKIPMTEFGRSALQYAEDAGIVSRNLFDESATLGQHAVGTAVQAGLGWTIGFPEKVARMGAFMSFAHHLEASGKYASKLELFRKAEELTDRSMTSFKSFDRPQVVNNLGVVGQGGYMFKSFLFNAFNNLNIAARHAGRGTIAPLATMVAMYGLMGGLTSVPLVSEMDTMWNTFKDLVANVKPEMYSKVKDTGIKSSILSLLPQSSAFRDIAESGVVSAATGVAFSSRFNMASGIDPEHLGRSLAAPMQELKEQGATAKAILNPTSGDAWKSAAYDNAPPVVQGNMESRLSSFKGPENPSAQLQYKPVDLLKPTPMDYRRNEFDTAARKLGVKSLSEQRDLETHYTANEESMRVNTALKGIVDKPLASAIKTRNNEQFAASIQAYLQLNPDDKALDAAIKNKVNELNLTPSEARLVNMRSMLAINNFMRYKAMNK